MHLNVALIIRGGGGRRRGKEYDGRWISDPDIMNDDSQETALKRHGTKLLF